MTKPSLSNLYRQSANLPVDALDADTLVRAAAGTLSADQAEAVAQVLASSPVHADLARMLRALEPAAVALARDTALVHAPDHARRSHGDRRHASAARRERRGGWQLGAVAACLIAGVALWTSRPHHMPSQDDTALAVRDDVIFDASSMDRLALEPSTHDVIFRGSGAEDRPDEIFSARLGKGG